MAAELGVVMLLYITGLEMQPSRLRGCASRSSAWALCRSSTASCCPPPPMTGGMLAGRELMIGNGGSETPKDLTGPDTTPDESPVGG